MNSKKYQTFQKKFIFEIQCEKPRRKFSMENFHQKNEIILFIKLFHFFS